MAFMDTHPDTSLFHLLREMKDDIADLIRKEIVLAKREAISKARDLGKSVALFGAAVGIALFAVFYMCIFLEHLLMMGLVALGLSMLTAAWIGPLMLGVLLGIGALALLLGGLHSLKHADPKPGSWRTVRSIRALRGPPDARPAEKARALGKAASKRNTSPAGKG
jgi:hypothetical protein